MENATETNKEWYLEADGSVVQYPDAYQIPYGDVEASEKMEKFILNEQRNIKVSFLRIGAALNVFEQKKLYLGRGLPSMRAWLDSPDVEISYRLAHDLMRIAGELLPKIGDRVEDIPVSTLREMLPMLSDGSSDEAIMEMLDDVQGLSTRDAKKVIRERRGAGTGTPPVIFHAEVLRGEEYHKIRITRAGEDGDIYEVTKTDLMVKPKDFHVFEKIFGNFMDYV